MNIFIVYRADRSHVTVAAVANSEELAQEICKRLRATNNFFAYSYKEQRLCQTTKDLG